MAAVAALVAMGLAFMARPAAADLITWSVDVPFNTVTFLTPAETLPPNFPADAGDAEYPGTGSPCPCVGDAPGWGDPGFAGSLSGTFTVDTTTGLVTSYHLTTSASPNEWYFFPNGANDPTIFPSEIYDSDFSGLTGCQVVSGCQTPYLSFYTMQPVPSSPGLFDETVLFIDFAGSLTSPGQVAITGVAEDPNNAITGSGVDNVLGSLDPRVYNPAFGLDGVPGDASPTFFATGVAAVPEPSSPPRWSGSRGCAAVIAADSDAARTRFWSFLRLPIRRLLRKEGGRDWAS